MLSKANRKNQFIVASNIYGTVPNYERALTPSVSHSDINYQTQIKITFPPKWTRSLTNNRSYTPIKNKKQKNNKADRRAYIIMKSPITNMLSARLHSTPFSAFPPRDGNYGLVHSCPVECRGHGRGASSRSYTTLQVSSRRRR